MEGYRCVLKYSARKQDLLRLADNAVNLMHLLRPKKFSRSTLRHFMTEIGLMLFADSYAEFNSLL